MEKDNLVEEMYFNEIRKYDKVYSKIISSFSLDFPKPLNLQNEKEKFFSALKNGEIYNPQMEFDFKVFDEKLLSSLKGIKINLKSDLYGFKELYNERLETKFYEIKCYNTWGTIISTDYSLKYLGKPSYFLVMKAKHFCKAYKREVVKIKKISEKFLAKELKNYVKELTGDNIQIEFTKMFSKVSIFPANKKIKINKEEKFTNLDLERLKVHEIGVHYMRYFNGRKFIPEILKTGTSNYLETEEGLAAYVEELKGVSSSSQIFIYAGRVIATYYSLKMSFYEVFMILKKFGFKDNDAFTITFRAKRNLCDTSQPGGFTKDYVYFSGYYKIKDYINGDIEKLKDLFIGKIRLKDLKTLSKFIKKNRNKIKTIFD